LNANFNLSQDPSEVPEYTGEAYKNFGTIKEITSFFLISTDMYLVIGHNLLNKLYT
jgi:hypothetical protein